MPTHSVNLYSLAGQTIFQVLGVDGVWVPLWKSYPQSADGHIDHSMAIRRTKEEFEAEKLQLRKG